MAESERPDEGSPPTNGAESTVVRDGETVIAEFSSGDRIGHYIIRELLGEGGFAVVYLAEQTDPVRRRVALKIIKPGMDSKQVIARFEAERQTLAMMDHPLIARVFDAGVTSREAGTRPYFVMEHVPGIPITEHCDHHRLDIHERLTLFMQVCSAVQYAHQKGIIHRDLKPSNILVSIMDDKIFPKVIDFGVAKALHQKLTEQTLYTEMGQLIGTPEYMSPEQAEMTAQDIDTRSDIYSLGVLLYELLTGAMPFDPKSFRRGSLVAIQRIICDEDPPRPSTRLNNLGEKTTASAKNRKLDTRALQRELRGDLDWIVMKALEKNRSRRYETANGLAMDIGRYLNHEPVTARPPSTAYKLSKFVRRNRKGVIAAMIVMGALIAGMITTSWQAVRARKAEAGATAAQLEAERRRNQAEDLISFMLGDLRSRLEPVGRLDVLQAVGDKAEDYFASLSESELDDDELFRRSTALRQIGEVRLANNDIPAASRAFEESLVLAEGLVRRNAGNGEWQIGLGASEFWIGNIRWLQHDLDGALTHFQTYKTIAETLVDLDAANPTYQLELSYGHTNLGAVYQEQGRLDLALPAIRESIRIKTGLLEADPENGEYKASLANGLSWMSNVQVQRGDLTGALQTLQDELRRREAICAKDHRNMDARNFLAICHNLNGNLHLMHGRIEEAETHYRSMQALTRELTAHDPTNLEWSLHHAVGKLLLGETRMTSSDLDQAAAFLQESERLLLDLVENDPTNIERQLVLTTLLNRQCTLAMVKTDIQRAKDYAERSMERINLMRSQEADSRHLARTEADTCLNLGQVLATLSRPEEAEAIWQQGLAVIEPLAAGRTDPQALGLQAMMLLCLQRPEEARPIVDDLLQRGYRHPDFMRLTTNLNLNPD